MPRAAPYPAPLLGLIQSTSYPPLPSLDDLEQLRRVLVEHKSHRRKRDRDEDSAGGSSKGKAVVESNEKAGRVLEAAERHRLDSAGPAKVKKERSLSPVGSVTSAASFKPGGSQPITYAGINKKKKKRPLDSDDEGRERSVASPPTHHTTSTSGLKLKINKARPVDPSPTPSGSTLQAPVAVTSNGTTIDFSLPSAPARPLIPPRPGVQPPPKPGPKRQADVDEDYSNTKAPSQIAQPTFWSSVEPYLRDIREDDLAMLHFKADAPELYEIPARGRHYTEVWDEEDANPPGTTTRFSVPSLRQTTSTPSAPITPHYVPATELKDEHLVQEHKGLGALTERLVAGLLGRSKKRQDSAGDANRYDGNRDIGKVDVADFEDRLKRELKAVTLLGEHDDYNPVERDDDEVTAALRQCQRLLLEQTQINDARKSRLAEIAKHRLAYAEYQQALDGVEKSIEQAWTRRVKKHGAAPKKVASGSGSGQTPTTHGRPPIPEATKKLVQTRRNWVETVGKTMKERPRGEVAGLPLSSVYEGIGDEIDERTVEETMALETMDVDEE